ncbi:acyl-CoA thioesterase [Rubinisphaera margarita]|uniref:acyl-CoA thioesterase n=1 Tax=Rubinisphaera margarita TaxID=2909586 RepID=UPI001EE8424A|nr:thioesterase family protein [Rubinisphaera margarita]MCG6156698.1 acyl-CoA thioesterase [Rubinisphaera margarita]
MSVPQSQFVYERRIAFAETDMAGIVHFSNYYRLMEEAEHAYFRSLGLSIMHRRDDGVIVGWPRVNTHCQYLAPARYEDIIQVYVDVERLGVKSITWSMAIYRGETKLAQGRMKTACCLCRADHTLESIPIASPYADKLQESPYLGQSEPVSR